MFYDFFGDFQLPRIGLCCFTLKFSVFCLCSTCVLLVFYLCSLVFCLCSLVFCLCSLVFYLCSLVFHLCSTCVHLGSLVFTCVLLVFICVLLVFICVHSCSFVFLLIDGGVNLKVRRLTGT